MDWKLKVSDIVSDFLESRKHSNRLLELESLVLSPDKDSVLASLDAVLAVFSKVFSREMTNDLALGKNREYEMWLFNRYEDFVSHLLSYLLHENKDIQLRSLKVLMEFVQLETKHQCRDGQFKETFPFTLFQKIVSSFLSDQMDMSTPIKAFVEYACYEDVKFYTFKSVCSLLNQLNELPDMCLQNCISLLCSIRYPKDFTNYELFTNCETFQLKEKPFRKMFSSVWSCVLSHKLSGEQLKRVLFVLNENILSHLQNPCILTDFLVDAYNSGGIVSLLALKGLFILMDQYNLEYPDFFIKLYALLDPKIVNGKFGTYFFNLINLFLSSTHLPSHIVAAFVKKLSKLSLVSSTSNVLQIQSIIVNILSRHPSLEPLLHREDENEHEEDHFNGTTKNPAESNAMKSSLWEIKTLQNHIYAKVCSNSKRLTAAYPKFEVKVPKESMDCLYQKERKRKLEDVPLAIQKQELKKR